MKEIVRELMMKRRMRIELKKVNVFNKLKNKKMDKLNFVKKVNEKSATISQATILILN